MFKFSLISLNSSLAPEETFVSRIILISQRFKRRDHRDGACGHFEKHHQNFNFLCSVYSVAAKQTIKKKKKRKQHHSWSIVVALCPSCMLLQENWTMSLLFGNFSHLSFSYRCGWVCRGEWRLPAGLHQHPRLLPLPLSDRIQAALRWAHMLEWVHAARHGYMFISCVLVKVQGFVDLGFSAANSSTLSWSFFPVFP